MQEIKIPMKRVLETERLYLREMESNDLDFMAEMLCHPEVTRFYPKQYSRDESGEWINGQIDRYEKDGHGLWLVENKEDAKLLGQVGLLMQSVRGERLPEIGYMIHFPYWRKGYAYEAASAVKFFAQENFGYTKVISLIRPENKPSRAVAIKLGMESIMEVDHGGFNHYVYHCILTVI